MDVNDHITCSWESRNDFKLQHSASQVPQKILKPPLSREQQGQNAPFDYAAYMAISEHVFQVWRLYFESCLTEVHYLEVIDYIGVFKVLFLICVVYTYCII